MKWLLLPEILCWVIASWAVYRLLTVWRLDSLDIPVGLFAFGTITAFLVLLALQLGVWRRGGSR